LNSIADYLLRDSPSATDVTTYKGEVDGLRGWIDEKLKLELEAKVADFNTALTAAKNELDPTEYDTLKGKLSDLKVSLNNIEATSAKLDQQLGDFAQQIS